MSFKVGQILSNNLSNVLKLVNFSIGDLETTNDITLNKFIDKRIMNITDGNNNGLVSNQHYYVKLVIKRKFPTSNQNITLRLSNDGGTNSSKNYQYVDDFLIYSGDMVDTNNLEYAVYETIITPHAAYSQINIILGRQMIDYYTTVDPETGLLWEQSSNNIENYKGREIELLENECQIYKLNTVLTGSVPSTLTKIGIQGPPGMLMCINGEPIRIGPSGIYEIKNGYQINFLSFVQKVNNIDNGGQNLNNDSFIVDYQYEV